jgi:elongation of very long chain fatty acids protein 4
VGVNLLLIWDLVGGNATVFFFFNKMSAVAKYAPFLCLLHFVHLFAKEKEMAVQHQAQGSSLFTPDLKTPIAGSLFYILLVTVGPKLMMDRKPFVLKHAMMAYNAYQVVYNTWCCYGFVREVSGMGYANKMNVWGNYVGDIGNTFGLGFFVWLHYNNKYLEFFDSIFMVLRKKSEQLSFLHVYHHMSIAWCWWLVCKVLPGGDSYFGALFNSFIHVLMYSYYFMAALKIPCPWKKWLTKMQMVQFLTCIGHAVYLYVYKTVPDILPIVQVFMMSSLFVLFYLFYMRKYKSNGKAAGKKTK